MQHWLLNGTWHHSTDKPDWYANIKAETKNEAILEAYKVLLNEFLGEEFEDLTIEKLRPILTQEELHIQLRLVDEYGEGEGEVVDFILWNKIDKYRMSDEVYYNRGVGMGEKVEDTNKYENMWFQLHERKEHNLDLAIRGYQWYFDKLPNEMKHQILNYLDENVKD